MLRHVPIRLRLTLWYVALLAIILAVFIASVYLLLRQSLYRHLDESMLNQANALLDVVQYEGDRLSLPSEVSEMDRSQDEDFVRLFDASGNYWQSAKMRQFFSEENWLGKKSFGAPVVAGCGLGVVVRSEPSPHFSWPIRNPFSPGERHLESHYPGLCGSDGSCSNRQTQR